MWVLLCKVSVQPPGVRCQCISCSVQEASKPPNGKGTLKSKGSIDAANAAQFVRHLEEDPLIQTEQADGGLSRMQPHTENLTNGLRACATPQALADAFQLPIMTREIRTRVMGILWANWEVSRHAPMLSLAYGLGTWHICVLFKLPAEKKEHENWETFPVTWEAWDCLDMQRIARLASW